MSRAALCALGASLVLAAACGADVDPPTEDPWCRISGAIECPRRSGTAADAGFSVTDAGRDGS